MKLWTDVVRPAPEGYIWCKSVNEAKEFILQSEQSVTELRGMWEALKAIRTPEDKLKVWASLIEEEVIEIIDLDYDSGDYEKDGGPYIKLMDWLVERGTLYPLAFHSQNCVGMEYMKRMYRRYWLGESL